MDRAAQFNGLLRTYLGAVEDESGLAYLRPETAQGIFINFANVLQTSRRKAPFGIGQIGKSFRNEITPGNFIFRTREFEQMEMEFFVRRARDEEWHQYWIDAAARLVHRPRHRPGQPAALRAPAGEAARTTRSAPSTSSTASTSSAGSGASSRASPTAPTTTCAPTRQASRQDLSYFDQESGERYVPYVIEPAAGVDRGMLAFLLDAYAEDEAPNTKGGWRSAPCCASTRGSRRSRPRCCRCRATPTCRRRPGISPPTLRKRWNVDFDDAGAIGRRYRRQDEIGTPFCVTVDFDSLEDQAVTVRERDSMAQERIGIDALQGYLTDRLPIW